MKKNISKILNIISTVTSVIMISYIAYFNYLSEGISFNGGIILLGLCMLLINPIINLVRLNKKMISNPVYHFMLIMIALYNSYICHTSIEMYYQNYSSDFGNSARLYFSNQLIYMMGGIVGIFLFSFLFKKDTILSKKDYTKLFFIIIAFTSFLPYLNDTTTIKVALSIGLFLFSLVMFFKTNNYYSVSELQKLYLTLFILTLLTVNVISSILIIYMYVQLDHFGLRL